MVVTLDGLTGRTTLTAAGYPAVRHDLRTPYGQACVNTAPTACPQPARVGALHGPLGGRIIYICKIKHILQYIIMYYLFYDCIV